MNRVVGFIGAIAIISSIAVGSSVPCWYAQSGRVLSPVTIETEDGNLWAVDTEYEPGTEIKVWFHDMETPDKEDDYIWWVHKK